MGKQKDDRSSLSLYQFWRENWKLILIELAMTVVVFGYNAYSRNIRVDTEVWMLQPNTTFGWQTIGRYALIFFKKILGLGSYQIVKSGTLFILFFWAAQVTMLFGFWRFSGARKYCYFVFVLLYTTSCIWNAQGYFLLQQAEVALAMWVTVIGALVMAEVILNQKVLLGILGSIFSMGMLVVSLGSYQALAIYYVAILLSFILLYFLEDAEHETMKKVSWYIVRAVAFFVHFIISYLIYFKIANTWYIAGGYSQNRVMWREKGIVHCLLSICRDLLRELFGEEPTYISFFGIGCILSLFSIARFSKKHKTAYTAVYVLILFCMWISPFLLVIYCGARQVPRAQFAMPVIAAVFAMLFLYQVQEKDWWLSRRAVPVIRSLIAVVVLLQLMVTVRLQQMDDIRYRQDRERADEILLALEETCGEAMYETPIVFLGAWKVEKQGIWLKDLMYGYSFFEWDCVESNLIGGTGRAVSFIEAYTGKRLVNGMSEENRQRAMELEDDIPCFPESHAVLQMEDLILVKFYNIYK